jgi:hypothetical protein
VVAHAAFGGTARDVVLHAKSGENFHLAAIEFHGNGNFQHAARRAQNLT